MWKAVRGFVISSVKNLSPNLSENSSLRMLMSVDVEVKDGRYTGSFFLSLIL